jgi:hypothetical protein
VQGTTSYLDKDLFVSFGNSLERLNNATKSKPKKAFEKITAPGQKDGEDE